MASTVTTHSGQNSGVLLLGASGQLGQMLRTHWPSPANLACQSRQADPEFITFDLILEPEQAAAAMAGRSAVICLSGVTNARVASHGDVYSRNTDLALSALRSAAKAGVGRVFLASSAAVYGTAGGVQKETSTPQPANEYGHAKLAMEKSALQLAKELAQEVTALRIGNVAGADAILGGWSAGMRLDQFASGKTPERSYIGPQTLTRVLAQLCETPALPRVINIATPSTTEMGELLNEAKLGWAPRTAPASAIPRVELCTERLEHYITFAPEESTAAGLVQEWKNFKAKVGDSS